MIAQNFKKTVLFLWAPQVPKLFSKIPKAIAPPSPILPTSPLPGLSILQAQQLPLPFLSKWCLSLSEWWGAVHRAL